ALEHRAVESREETNPTREALRKVDLAAHRGARDRSDFALDAHHVCDLIDALDRDERRIHVDCADADTFKLLLGGHERVVDSRLDAALGDASTGLDAGQSE